MGHIPIDLMIRQQYGEKFNMISQYSFSEFIKNIYSLILTKLIYPHARLIRRPIYIRGRKHLQFDKGLTTGYCCRFDLDGKGKTLIIGSNCKMNDRVHIVAHNHVKIGNDVLMASNIFISDTSHGSYNLNSSSPYINPDDRELVTSSVVIGDRVWIGEGAAILPGVSIGDGCVVGAHAVVTHSFPNNSIIIGAPAKAIKKWDGNKYCKIK